MPSPDYYQSLGVSRSASKDEIRKAYRKLARENHPDVKKDDPQAAARFREVQEAYDILSDEKKKAQYDQFGTVFPEGAVPPGGGGGFGGFQGGAVDLGDLFGGGGIDLGDLFGGAMGGGRRRRGPGPGRRPMPGQDLQTDISVPFETAARGGSVDVRVAADHHAETLSVKIPAGVADGAVIRLAGQGNPSPMGGPPGDLLLKVRVQPHRYFRREGADIYVDVPLTPAEAALGTRIDVPTLSDGIVVLTVPPGTSTDKKLRLRGKGTIDSQTKQPGDQYVVIKIVVPPQLDPEAKQLYEQLRTREENPRVNLW